MAEFDFRELVAQAFDYVGPPFPLWTGDNLPVVIPGLNFIKGRLGEKFFLKLTLSNEGDEYTFPNEPLVSLGKTKTIVETATVGTDREGAVLEYITTENWSITIKGVIYDPEFPDDYPAKEVVLLNDFFNVNKSVAIVDSKFFELYGVKQLVLRDIFFDEMIGFPGAQKYVITATSDSDFYADLDAKNNNA